MINQKYQNRKFDCWFWITKICFIDIGIAVTW